MSEVQKDIELDLDDVQEESIEIEAKEEVVEESVADAVGEVDLGYKEPLEEKQEEAPVKEAPVKEAPAEEAPVEEVASDNLVEVSEKTQKRIDKLTRKMREAERREKAALDYAKGLQTKYDTANKQVQFADENLNKEFDARVDAQREQVRIKLQDAIEASDSAKIVEANDELTRLAVEKEKARMRFAEIEDIKAQEKIAKEQEPQQNQPVQQPPSVKAQDWAKKNTWFGNDEVMTNAAFSIHNELIKEGFDSESDDYYNEVNNRLKEYFPNKLVSAEKVEEKKPVQTVASAGRKQQGRKTVKLTRSQVAIAKKLGVPLEEYAKFVKE
tara:strand:- start:1881 stop:2861 length:981 start_codon:yes stop_codon:yes gene_type:complete